MIKTPRSEEFDVSDPATFDAADWVALLNSDQAADADLSVFEAWAREAWARQEGPNAGEYVAHQQLWNTLGRLVKNPEAHAILRPPRKSRLTRRIWIGLTTGALAACMAIAGLVTVYNSEEVYRTGRGEQLNITLDDGSRVTLNTDTRLTVQLNGRERLVRINHGQTYIRVAKDPSRPFRVLVRETEVRALGTAFDVYLDDSAVRVTMAEGTAAIYNDEAPSTIAGLFDASAVSARRTPVAVISSGQQLTAGPLAPVKVITVDPRASGAWRENRIIFDRTPLAEAIRDVNRYLDVPIVIGSADTQDMLVTGTYRIDRLALRALNRNRKGFPGHRKSDSRYWLGMEASMYGKTLSGRTSGTRSG